MTDPIADTTKLMRMIEALTLELDRQGVVEVLSNLGFSVTSLAEAAIRAAEQRTNSAAR